MRKIHLLAMVILSLLLCSCAGRTLQPADPAAAQNRWQAFTQQSNIKSAPFRDSLSMRFGKEGDTRRVTALIWGNGDKTLRLDVLAGVGAVVANIAQKDNHFFIYTPMQRKAYFHEGASSPLLKVGVPLPFDLFSLEALLNGRYTDVFGKEFVRAAQQGDSIIYTLGAGSGGELTLGPDARPAVWKDENWKLLFTLDGTGLLHRLDLSNNKGGKGIVIVKERDHTSPFGENQMKIQIPEGTKLLPLERFQQAD